MDNYYPIALNDLDIIRPQVLKIVAKHASMEKSRFFYFPLNEVFEIKELTTQLETLGLLSYVHRAAINLFYTNTPVVHRDTGDYVYSLNIPIAGYTNTFIGFYQSTVEPTLTHNRDASYFKVDTKDCTLIEKHETVVPAIVNTSALHAFENPNAEPRIMLLLRFNKKIDRSVWSSMQA